MLTLVHMLAPIERVAQHITQARRQPLRTHLDLFAAAIAPGRGDLEDVEALGFRVRRPASSQALKDLARDLSLGYA